MARTTTPCSHCRKPGHTPATCWTLHPEQLPWKRTEAIEEEQVDVGGFDVGYVEVRQGQRRPRSAPIEDHVETENRFQVLTTEDEDVEIGFVDIETPEEPVAAIGVDRRTLRSAGRGKITVESGAAEVVLSLDVVPNETLIEGEAKKKGVRYVAANGGRMETWARRE